MAALLCQAIFLMPGQSQAQATTAANPAATADIQSEKFDDWYYRCGGQAEARTCEVAQIAQVSESGKAVSVLTLAFALPAGSVAGQSPKKEKGALTLTALLPLNVLLPEGFAIKANGKPLTKLEYRNCNQAGCWAQQSLDQRMLTSLGKSDSAEGLLRLVNGQDVNIRFSLKGLKSALDKLQGTRSR